MLSFTRTAVGELRRRIGLCRRWQRSCGRSRSTPSPRAVLASSFASRAPNWRELGYDGRIAAATALLAEEPTSPLVEDCKHVFVDEIQDLVGVRASMVMALLERVDGFTLLGDPAQAIYDHQVRDDADATTSARFRRPRPHAPSRLADVHARGELPGAKRRVERSRRCRCTSFGRTDVDPASVAWRSPRSTATSNPSRPSKTSRPRCEAPAEGSRCSAARTSTLCASRDICTSGREHRLQREATDRALPVLARRPVPRHGADDAGQAPARGARRGALRDEDPDAETVWRLLSETVGDDDADRPRGASPSHLARDRVRRTRRTPAADVVVSTSIARKGSSSTSSSPPSRPAMSRTRTTSKSSRILYVALSRAREELWTFPPPPASPGEETRR